MSDDVPEQFRPRLCHVVKWSDFPGYGFNLHAEKGKAGQFIGKVDDNSPAEAAGLKEGDRIVEVNGVNIGNENHQQVVTRIKSGGEETRLLVVDAESDNWYKEQKKVVKGDLPEVLFISAKRDGDEPTAPVSQEEEESQIDSHPDPEPELEEPVIATISAAPVENGNDLNEDDSHRPRLCHLKTWPHFQGYGFNLHAERDKPGQFIGLVDDNSPSSTAGLRVNDRIIEVNGVNIESETHTEVIARIKAVPGETKLLVVDQETDMYYREKGTTVSSNMAQTEYRVTPDAADDSTQKEQVVDVESQFVDLDDAEGEGGQVKEDGRNVDGEEDENLVEFSTLPSLAVVEQEPEDSVNGLKSQAPQPPEHEPEFTVASDVLPQELASAPSAKGADGLELNLSVAEMKERIKAKKRQDPRMNKISFEQKYKEFQRM